MYQLVLLIVCKAIDAAAGHDATLCVFLLSLCTAIFHVIIIHMVGKREGGLGIQISNPLSRSAIVAYAVNGIA